MLGVMWGVLAEVRMVDHRFYRILLQLCCKCHLLVASLGDWSVTINPGRPPPGVLSAALHAWTKDSIKMPSIIDGSCAPI